MKALRHLTSQGLGVWGFKLKVLEGFWSKGLRLRVSGFLVRVLSPKP